MKRLLRSSVIAILTTLTVQTLVSCGPKSAKSSAPGVAAPTAGEAPAVPGAPVIAPGPGKGANVTDGTSSSGGGTGVDLKVFESYIKDPTTKSAYIHFVKPLLDNLKPADPAKQTYYEKVFHFRTWYFGPVDLENIKKDVLGISFMKSATQQMARQTMKKIWVDTRIYDQMKEQDQGDLLVHEFVMTLYLMRFLTLDQLCEQSVVTGLGECSNMPDYFKNAMVPEKERPLNDDDYEHIQFVTGWLLQHAQKPIAEVEFIKILQLQHFDPRFFNPKQYVPHTPPPVVKISRREILEAFTAAKLTNTMPELCTNADKSTTVPCKIEISDRPWPGDQGSTLSVKVIQGNQEVLSMESPLTWDNTLSDFEDPVLHVHHHAFSLQDFKFEKKYKVGDRTTGAFLFLREVEAGNQKHWVLDSVTFVRGVIVSLDKTRELVCTAMPMKPTGTFQENFIVHRQEKDSLVMEQLPLLFPLASPCNKENVAE